MAGKLRMFKRRPQKPSRKRSAAIFGLGGSGLVLVKNWRFGTRGTIKNYADMNANFLYHDQFGTFNNGNSESGATVCVRDSRVDDDPQARALGLTSLRPPMQGMTREAARLLVECMGGNDGSLRVRLRAHVIPRASTARPQ